MISLEFKWIFVYVHFELQGLWHDGKQQQCFILGFLVGGYFLPFVKFFFVGLLFFLVIFMRLRDLGVNYGFLKGYRLYDDRAMLRA